METIIPPLLIYMLFIFLCFRPQAVDTVGIDGLAKQTAVGKDEGGSAEKEADSTVPGTEEAIADEVDDADVDELSQREVVLILYNFLFLFLVLSNVLFPFLFTPIT